MIRLKFIVFIIIIFFADITFAKSPFDYNLKLADSHAPLKTVYLHLSGEYGKVVNSNIQPLQYGLGGTVSFLIPDDWLNKRNKNYFTLGAKGLNNPHPGERYFITMNLIGDDAHEIDNSFNYFQILAGYRFSRRIRDDGTYFEPRVGYILWDFHDNDNPTLTKGPNHAIVFSPTYGYVYKNFDFAVFSDLGYSKRRTNIFKNNFLTLGISIGYNFGLYRVNTCRCEPYDYF